MIWFLEEKELHVNSLYHASMRTYIVNMPHLNTQGMKSAVLKSIDGLTSLQLLLPAAQCVRVYVYVQYALSIESSRVLTMRSL